MNIIVNEGMVNIECNGISYGNIKGMYKGDIDGSGLQIDSKLTRHSDDIHKLCDDISELIYKLQDIIGD